MTKVLGVDPGSVRTGFGVVRVEGRRVAPVAFGTLAGGRGALALRLVAIGRALERVLDEHAPDVVGIEEAFHARHARATLVLGQVRGVALWLAAARGLPVVELAPRAVKLAVTGRGGASKPQVAEMVRRMLDLAERPAADAADALAVALSCARRFELAARTAGREGARDGRAAGGARPRTARGVDGSVVDLARAFAPVKRGHEAAALAELVERAGLASPSRVRPARRGAR